MPNGLNAIYDELRRLQQEGVDRVYIDDQTATLLIPAKPAPEPESTAPSSPTPTTKVDLSELIDKPTREHAPSPAPAPKQATVSIPELAPTIELPSGDANSQLKWLQTRVESCPVCNRHLSEGEKVVFGGGSAEADILFCGEAPAAEEALTGEPFVGNAGLLLTKIIAAMGLGRDSVYITNILKWRPQHDKPYGNRPPTENEMHFCLPYLKAQIEIIKPKVIVALGNTAVSGLLGQDPQRHFSSLRGTWQTFESTPTMITFHPSYLLRNDTLKTKRMIWEDMLQVMEKVALPISEKQREFFLPKS